MIVEIRRREGQSGIALDVSWEQKLNIGQFYGFELNWWPAKIAETAMFLVDHQANRELADAIGVAPDRLPITITAHITHGNALELDWDEILPEVPGETYVFGNPPFIGQYTKTSEQTADMKRVWGKDYDGYLDYVTAWHAKSKDLLAKRKGQFAYVTTNSITQGQPVPALFGPLFRENWRIKFAHRTFSWDSEAPGKAAVHCVIVGFDRATALRPRLWDYPSVKGEPVEIPVDRGINAYLIDGPNVLVTKSMQPISPRLPPCAFGSKPTDGGHLIIEVDEYEEVMADAVAAKYVRPFRMGRELVQGLDRWCLWLEDLDPADLPRSPVLRSRIEACRQFRELSSTGGDAYKRRNTPHLMKISPYRPKADYVGIPQEYKQPPWRRTNPGRNSICRIE